MLKSKIGINAGEIWQFLDTNGEKSISEIEKALSMKKNDVLMALGWLAREDKIFFVEDKNDTLVNLIYE
jgi:hypothetical protein